MEPVSLSMTAAPHSSARLIKMLSMIFAWAAFRNCFVSTNTMA